MSNAVIHYRIVLSDAISSSIATKLCYAFTDLENEVRIFKFLQSLFENKAESERVLNVSDF